MDESGGVAPRFSSEGEKNRQTIEEAVIQEAVINNEWFPLVFFLDSKVYCVA